MLNGRRPTSVSLSPKRICDAKGESVLDFGVAAGDLREADLRDAVLLVESIPVDREPELARGVDRRAERVERRVAAAADGTRPGARREDRGKQNQCPAERGYSGSLFMERSPFS